MGFTIASFGYFFGFKADEVAELSMPQYYGYMNGIATIKQMESGQESNKDKFKGMENQAAYDFKDKIEEIKNKNGVDRINLIEVMK